MSRYDCRAQGCEWRAGEEEPRADLVAHAQEAGHWLCVVCALSLRPDEPQTCEKCLARVREHLAEIVEKYALLPEELGNLGSNAPTYRGGKQQDIKGKDLPLPGGDALVMLSPGSPGAGQARAIWRFEDSSHAADELPSDPSSVLNELATAEDDLRQHMGMPAAEAKATVVGCAGFLEVNMRWAANNHPAFDEFATTMRDLRMALRVRTATDERPVQGPPCLHDCNARLEQRRTDVRQDEDWSCPRCHRAYSSQAYWLAVKAQMEARAS